MNTDAMLRSDRPGPDSPSRIEADLGTFSMFGRTRAPHKWAPHGPPFLAISLTITNSGPTEPNRR